MMDFSEIKKLSIGGIELKQLFLNGIQVWKSGYKNWVPYSTEADGKTIYNGGLGYKDGYRIRSGGAEATADHAVCTGYIPFQYGDVLRLHPWFNGANSNNALNFYDVEFNNLGQYNDSGAMYGICSNDKTAWTEIESNPGGCSVIDISKVSNGGDIAYVRITHAKGDYHTNVMVQTGSQLIVTVNEEIT